jgi:hypothetical protein
VAVEPLYTWQVTSRPEVERPEADFRFLIQANFRTADNPRTISFCFNLEFQAKIAK